MATHILASDGEGTDQGTIITGRQCMTRTAIMISKFDQLLDTSNLQCSYLIEDKRLSQQVSLSGY